PSLLEGTSDSRQYFKVVVEGPRAADEHWRSRVLVPFLAKPLYRLAANRAGSWNPVALALLVVNSAFCATAAWLLILLAEAFGLLVRSTIAGALVTPIRIASDERALETVSDIPRTLIDLVGSSLTWITFVWLLPFAVLGLSRLPKDAWRATALGAAGVLALV